MSAASLNGPTLLVVAKAPVPGLAKTRIARSIGDENAATLASAALLDTLDAVESVGWRVVVAMTGDLDAAIDGELVRSRITRHDVIEQRGDGLGERLAHAHADADAGRGVVQIGMDTPQVSADDLRAAGEAVSAGHTVLGPAVDGGWWLLGVPDPAQADSLRDVPMSQPHTERDTAAAVGGDLIRLRWLRDMDTWTDAQLIAATLPDSRLHRAVTQVGVPA